MAVALGQRASSLLKILLEAEGGLVSKTELLERAWPGLIVEEVNLSVQIAGLRKALGKTADGREWIATVPRVGYRLPRAAAAASSGPPAIAVLPFDNMSSDPEQAYFADGVVEDITTALSRFRTFAVLARNSSFAYRNRAIDLRQVAAEMGVRYLLEGSVRRSGAQLRVTAQLIDAEAGTHLLAERSDGDLEGVFDFQDRITESVVGLIEPQIRRAEIERARRKRPENLDAYDLYLKALPCLRGADRSSVSMAVALLERAITLEPTFAPALAYAAWAYERQDTFGLAVLGDAERQRCLDLANAALATGADDPLVLAISAVVLHNIGNERGRPLAMVTQALRANPNNPIVLSLAGFLNVVIGDLGMARDAYLRSCQIGPGASDVHESIAGVGFAYFFERNFEVAIDWLQRAEASFAGWPPIQWTLAPAYMWLGRRDEARTAVARLRAMAPHLNLTEMRRIGVHSDSRFDLVVDGLRRAGLPER